MFEPNVQRVLHSLKPTDTVLDIGGWACPFNRANYVIDAMPYETRGFYRSLGWAASQGGDTEYFNRDRWIQRDLCAREPFPFRDKEIDFVICSHTLEDIRDPLWVCSEMIRVAKRGYIEVPSRVAESCRGWESPRIAGVSHHRWLIEIEDGAIRFLQKYHAIHSHCRYSFPPSFLRRLDPEGRIQWLFWNGSFDYAEAMLHGTEAQEAELAEYVHRIRPHSPARLRADAIRRVVLQLARQPLTWARRKARGRAERLASRPGSGMVRAQRCDELGEGGRGGVGAADVEVRVVVQVRE
jgi:hypothetical protein